MITAQLNTYRQSPRKVRLVSDLVKGKGVVEALLLLSVTTKEAAGPLHKLITSAVKNAKNSFNIEEKNLFVKEFRVDAGAVLKRSMPRARGSAFPILKRTSHIKLVLGEREGGEKLKTKSVKHTEDSKKEKHNH
ncbi:MAG: 50S ribosomal protein L22 [Patescibacteria group bacterium]